MNVGGEVGVVSVTARDVHSVVIAVNEIKVVSEVEVVIVVNKIDEVNVV